MSDVAVVAEIKLRMSARVWHWQLFAVLSMPLPLFFLTSTFVPDDSAALRRIIAGTLLFGIAFSIGLLVGNQFAYERFSRVQKLYVMMPVAKTAYVVGSLAHLSLMGVASVIVLSAFAMTRGIDVKIAWTLVPMLVLAVLVMVGLVLFIVSFAPSLDTANMSASTLGLVLAVMSPVYYTMEQAPLLIRWFGYVSPLRYAADGISASLSGSNGRALRAGGPGWMRIWSQWPWAFGSFPGGSPRRSIRLWFVCSASPCVSFPRWLSSVPGCSSRFLR